jgi:DNA invertase Pin-like site-specific DNA recombinase
MGKGMKGHPNYYKGKHTTADKFTDVFERYVNGEITQQKAAEELNITTMTLVKWFKALAKNNYSLEGVDFIKQDSL